MSSRIVRRFVVAIVMVLIAPAVNAQLFRAYLSTSGSDSNPCTLPSPCRLLPAAMTAVADGGEVWILDSANYNSGQVSISKSVTILAVPGVVGSFVASTGSAALRVNTAAVKLAVRNLSFTSLPGAANTFGIQVDSGSGLVVEQSRFAKLNTAILVQGGATVHVSDSIIRDSSFYGIELKNGPSASVFRTQLLANFEGLRITGSAASTSRVTVTESLIADNVNSGIVAYSTVAGAVIKLGVQSSTVARMGSYGLTAQSDAGAPVTISLKDNQFNGNAVGVAGFGAAVKIVASRNVLSDQQGAALSAASATLQSAGDNIGIGNGDFNFAVTPATAF